MLLLIILLVIRFIIMSEVVVVVVDVLVVVYNQINRHSLVKIGITSLLNDFYICGMLYKGRFHPASLIN